MKKIIFIFSVLAFMLSCENRYEEHFDELQLDNPELKIGKSAGVMAFYVYYDGDWTVEIEGECNWARIRNTSGKGVDVVRMDYDANPLVSRSLRISVHGGGVTKSILVTQAIGLVPEMQFEPESVDLPQGGDLTRVKLLTNVNRRNIGYLLDKVEYGEGDYGWLKGKELVAGEEEPVVEAFDTTFTYYVNLQAAPNNMGMTRTARLTYYLTDAAEKTYSATLNISQSY